MRKKLISVQQLKHFFFCGSIQISYLLLLFYIHYFWMHMDTVFYRFTVTCFVNWQPAPTELHIGAAQYQESMQYVISMLNFECIKILHNTVLQPFLLLVRC